MQSAKQSTLENLCSTKKHAFYVTRSLPEKQSLLPLRLLSPSPEINAWPSLLVDNRSTFRMSVPSHDEHEDIILQYKLESGPNSELGRSKCRSKPYRDIPIYTEPGSPLLSRAYLTDEELHSSCNTSDSDKWFDANRCSCIRIGPPECFECSRRTEVIIIFIFTEMHSDANADQGSMDNEDADLALDLLKHQLSSSNRSSDLSFQCSGEPESLYSDEAAWLRSPLSYQCRQKPSKMELETKTMPKDQKNRESWMSWLTDSSSGDEEDLLVSRLCLYMCKPLTDSKVSCHRPGTSEDIIPRIRRGRPSNTIPNSKANSSDPSQIFINRRDQDQSCS
jgi:hypothetical protein